MIKEEVIQVLKTINENYEYSFKNKTKEEKLLLIEDWYTSLKNYSYKEIKDRLQEHISKCKYVPTISDLIGNKTKSKFNNYTNPAITPENPYGLTDYDRDIIKSNYEKYNKYLKMTDNEFYDYLKS